MVFPFTRTCGVGLLTLGAALAFAPAGAWAQATAPATTGVTIDGNYGPFLPTDVSETGWQVDRLIHVLHWFMAILFFGWGAFFVYCLVRFRQGAAREADARPVKASVTKWLEAGVAVFEAVLLLGFSMPLWAMTKNQIPPPDDASVFRVKVVAEQFMWNFHYPGPDGVFGRTAPQFVNTVTNPVGVDPDDSAGADDITAGELHFPVGRTVVAELTSKDVIHSFFLPVMRVKQDVIPGMRIPVWFKARKTGTYEVACAQLCGNNHYSMRALMIIEPDEQAFETWLRSRQPEEFDEEAFD